MAEPLSRFLADSPALSVTLIDAADDPIYEPGLNEMPLWQNVQVIALFENDAEAKETLALLEQLLEYTPNYSVAIIEERDWITETQAQFTPQCFANRLWVYPEWQDIPTAHQPALKIAPGLGFGTGTHPTTQMCLAALASFVEIGMTVIDYGCGSGILGLAALTLGADYVYCVDIDPQALEATQNNALLNEYNTDNLFIGLADDLPKIKTDLLVANILAKPLIELRSVFETLLKPDGCLILAGILDTQCDFLIEAYKPWVTLTVFQQQAEWVCLTNE
jgi:ribosomal protein L11 methyltransferase